QEVRTHDNRAQTGEWESAGPGDYRHPPPPFRWAGRLPEVLCPRPALCRRAGPARGTGRRRLCPGSVGPTPSRIPLAVLARPSWQRSGTRTELADEMAGSRAPSPLAGPGGGWLLFLRRRRREGGYPDEPRRRQGSGRLLVRRRQRQGIVALPL